MTQRLAILLSVVILCSTFAFAQEVQVSRANKTIAVTAEATESATADLAIITFSHETWGPVSKDAYNANVTGAAKIIVAMKDAGVPNEAIETGEVSVGLVAGDEVEKWTPEERKAKRFKVTQSWTARIAAAEAQKFVDLVMGAGANVLEEVKWDLSDRAMLQAKAGGAGLAKARAIAEQMAKGLNAKLGELVYASNTAPSTNQFIEQYWLRGKVRYFTRSEVPALSLFPKKISEKATVHAVFAIE